MHMTKCASIKTRLCYTCKTTSKNILGDYAYICVYVYRYKFLWPWVCLLLYFM